MVVAKLVWTSALKLGPLSQNGAKACASDAQELSTELGNVYLNYILLFLV